MKSAIFITLFFLFCITFLHAQTKDYLIHAVDFTKVNLGDKFWRPRIEINRTVTIPASFERCENTGRIQNFLMAAKRSGKFCTRYPFDDTDIYKTIEGASYSLALFPDEKLSAYLDSLITIIGNAQEPDGYLYTARTIDPNTPHTWSGKERWEKERELSHELYNAGHLYEAAVAHYLATNKKTFLNIALKNANLVCSVFGTEKKLVAPGHEIVEMGLVKLYRITGEKKYLQTAKFFIEARGQYKGYDSASVNPWKNGSYWQDNEPVKLQTEAEGHAVRAGYLYSAVADVAALTGDDSLKNAIDKIWENVVSKKIYVQGSVGAKGDGERYGDNYELPNASAYNETCAAIANVFWNERMFLLHGDSKYIDVLEKTLYNGLLSGEGLDGKSFFYTNAMQVEKSMGKNTPNGFTDGDVEAQRSGWFECSCCPTNIVRLIPSIPGYMYAQQDNNVYINLFISSSASLMVNNQVVQIIQQNNYPWNGNLKFVIDPEKSSSFNINIRIPDWARNEAIPSNLYRFENNSLQHAIIKINGKLVKYNLHKGFAVLNKKWMKGDHVEVVLPMEVRKVVANNILKENNGKVALQRGPIIYCAEWVDNDGTTNNNIVIPSNAKFTTEFKPDLLNGVIVLKSLIYKKRNLRPFIAVPYYAWANRGKGEMSVWLKKKK
jgi:uncharacterized protein